MTLRDDLSIAFYALSVAWAFSYVVYRVMDWWPKAEAPDRREELKAVVQLTDWRDRNKAS